MATEPDKVDTGVLGTLAAVLACGLLATGLAVTALVRTEAEELTAERSGTNEAFADMRGAQEADLNLPPAYMDQGAGVVRLPIDRAMQVVVRDLRKNPESATAPKPLQNGDGASAAGEGAPVPDAADAAGEAGDKAAEADGAAEGDVPEHDGTGVKAPGKPPAPPKPKAPPVPKAPSAPKPAAPTAPVPRAPSPPPTPVPLAPPSAP